MPGVTDSLVLDLVDELFGGLVEPEVFGKRSQAQQERLEHNVARVSNAVGLAAGVAGTGSAVGAYRQAKKDPQGQAGPINRKLQHKLGISRRQAAKLTTVGAGSALALQFGNVAGDVITARVLGRGSKKKEEAAKADVKALAAGIVTGMRRQVAAVTAPAGKHVAKPPASPRVLTEHPGTGAPLGATPGNSSRFNTVQGGQVKPVHAEQMSMFGPNLGEAAAATDPTKGFQTARGVQSSERAERVAAPVAHAFQAAKTHPKTTAAVGVLGTGSILSHRNKVKSQQMQDPYAMYKRDGVDEVTFGGTFSKFNEDKRLAFGWASVVELNGSPVIDRQGDYISLEDIEEAAYVYVKKSGVGGDMHRRTPDDKPHQVGKLVESVVFTPEKCEAMGIPKDVVGKWWIGMHVDDDDAWEQVKLGKRAGFSIHGKGLRKDVEYDAVMEGR